MLARLSVVLFAVSVVLAGGSGGYGDQSDHESGSCDTGRTSTFLLLYSILFTLYLTDIVLSLSCF